MTRDVETAGPQSRHLRPSTLIDQHVETLLRRQWDLKGRGQLHLAHQRRQLYIHRIPRRRNSLRPTMIAMAPLPLRLPRLRMHRAPYHATTLTQTQSSRRHHPAVALMRLPRAPRADQLLPASPLQTATSSCPGSHPRYRRSRDTRTASPSAHCRALTRDPRTSFRRLYAAVACRSIARRAGSPWRTRWRVYYVATLSARHATIMRYRLRSYAECPMLLSMAGASAIEDMASSRISRNRRAMAQLRSARRG